MNVTGLERIRAGLDFWLTVHLELYREGFRVWGLGSRCTVLLYAVAVKGVDFRPAHRATVLTLQAVTQIPWANNEPETPKPLKPKI